MPWKTFLARACAASGLFGVAMFAAIRLATADPGGPTRPELTYAGVLRDVDGGLPTTARTTTLTFMFAKSGVPLCTVSVPGVVIAVGGAFTANVPIASCGSGYFDGSDVTYEVAQDGEVLTPDGGVRITPVPYARFADQVGVNNDCPAGYAIANDTALPVGATLCRRGVDQIVKVGQGATAFWIDRYEANVNSNRDATGTYYFLREGDFPPGFPRNGQWRTPGVTTAPVYAVSIGSASPARWITWFQASAACRSSGKRLPSGEEWLLAANGTDDPGINDGLAPGNTRCNTAGGGARNTGVGRGCVSGWGAEDMIGNVWEWTGEWHASSGQVTSVPTFDHTMVTGSRANDQATPWPSDYRDDRTWNITSVASRSPLAGDDNRVGMPSAESRGGNSNFGTRTGVFAMMLAGGPSSWDPTGGFRCVTSR